MPDPTGRLSHGECLDPEVLSAFADGGLDTRTRARVQEHLASCVDCYDVMSEVLRVQEAVPAARPDADATPGVCAPVPGWGDGPIARGVFGRRRAVWTAATALLAATATVILVLSQPAWRTDGVDPKLADLVDAVGAERTVEARLTGGFKYGPLRSPVRAGGRVGPTDNWLLLTAAGKIREVAEASPTPENLHALGVASLLQGYIGRAVQRLSQAVEGDPANARYHSDLAAAYSARAVDFAHTDDLPRALEAVDAARALEPTLAEAAFNRALILFHLGDTEKALQAWRDYSALDSSSAWAAEARSRAADLQKAKE